MEPVRCFVALELEPGMRKELVALQGEMKRGFSPGRLRVRWEREENLHITLKFLGEIACEQVWEATVGALQRVVKGMEPLVIGCQGVGVFPNVSRPRIIWAGVERGGEELVELQGCVEGCLEGVGFEREKREFHPHITLARIKHPGRGKGFFVGVAEAVRELLAAHESWVVGEQRVSGIVLYQSVLTKQGAVYRVLRRFGFEEDF